MVAHQVVTSATGWTRLTEDLFGLYISTASTLPLGVKLQNFSYVHCKLRVRVVVQGQPFAAGLVALSFTPEPHDNINTNISLSTLTTSDITNYLVKPHLILDPSKTETYEILLDCPLPIGYFPIKDTTFGSYFMDLVPVNPLFSGTAVAASMNMCVYVSLVEPSFQAMTLFSGELQEERKEGGVVSRTVNSIAHLTSMVGNVFPSLSPYTTPLAAIGGGAGKILSLFGFSKPSETHVDSVVLNRFVDNYCHFDGISAAPVLAGTAGNSLSISGSIAGADPNDMLLRNIAAKKGYLRTVPIATTNVFGDLLHKMNVYPMMAATFGAGNTVTPLAGASTPFHYWSGDITLTFEIVASVFHRCTVLIAYDPYPNAADPSLTTALQTLQNVTVAVSGNTTTEVTIPWSQPKPWGTLGAFNTGTFKTGGDQGINGGVYVYLINPVTSNGSTDNIAMNIYIHSDNITWALPESGLVSGLTFQTRLLSGDLVEPTQVSFGPKSDLSLLTLRSFGENYNSVKDLTSKLTLSEYGPVTVTAGTNNLFFSWIAPNIPYLKTSAADVLPLFPINNLLTWFASAYVGYRGAMRYVCMIQDQDRNGNKTLGKRFVMQNAWTGTPQSFGMGTLAASEFANVPQRYAFTYSQRDFCPNAEITAPMLYPYDFVPMRRNVSRLTNYVEILLDLTGSATDLNLNQQMLTASGDDAMFVRFVGWSPIQ